MRKKQEKSLGDIDEAIASSLVKFQMHFKMVFEATINPEKHTVSRQFCCYLPNVLLKLCLRDYVVQY